MIYEILCEKKSIRQMIKESGLRYKKRMKLERFLRNDATLENMQKMERIANKQEKVSKEQAKNRRAEAGLKETLLELGCVMIELAWVMLRLLASIRLLQLVLRSAFEMEREENCKEKFFL